MFWEGGTDNRRICCRVICMQNHKRLNHFFSFSSCIITVVCWLVWKNIKKKKKWERDWFVSIKIRRYLLLVYSYCALCCFSFYSTRLGVNVPDCTSYFLLYTTRKFRSLREGNCFHLERVNVTNCSWSWLALENTRNGGENIWMSFDFQYSHLLFFHASFDCHDNALGGWGGGVGTPETIESEIGWMWSSSSYIEKGNESRNGSERNERRVSF